MVAMQGKHIKKIYISNSFLFIEKVQKGAQSQYMGSLQKEDPKEIKLTCTKDKLKLMRSGLKGISSPCKKILKRGGKRTKI